MEHLVVVEGAAGVQEVVVEQSGPDDCCDDRGGGDTGQEHPELGDHEPGGEAVSSPPGPSTHPAPIR